MTLTIFGKQYKHETDDLVLLACDTMQIRREIQTFQRNILSPSSGLKWLKMEAVCFSETLVSTYESMQHHNSEEHHHPHHHENLKYHRL
jgi:hypothetical protein